jgi:halocyanin-like protein
MSEEGLSRRDFVRATGGAATVAAAGAGVAGTTSAQEEPEYPDYLSSPLTDTGYEDLRGQSEVTIAVGPDGDFSFAPTLAQINPGTTVNFVWESNTHNVVVEGQPDGAGWSGYETIENTGFEYQHTFETLGTYTYFCQPHEASGMKGGIIVAEGEPAGGGGEQGPIAWPGYLSNALGPSETTDARGQSNVTVEVGGGGSGLAFLPPRLHVDPGTTITFEWTSTGHNVLPNSQPDGSGWEGIDELESEGFVYEHTFETGGMYTYFCSPHEGQGMKGGIAVGDDVPREAIDTSPPVLPQEAKTLLVATMGALGTTLALAYFFLKYGGNPPTEVEA